MVRSADTSKERRRFWSSRYTGRNAGADSEPAATAAPSLSRSGADERRGEGEGALNATVGDESDEPAEGDDGSLEAVAVTSEEGDDAVGEDSDTGGGCVGGAVDAVVCCAEIVAAASSRLRTDDGDAEGSAKAASDAAPLVASPLPRRNRVRSRCMGVDVSTDSEERRRHRSPQGTAAQLDRACYTTPRAVPADGIIATMATRPQRGCRGRCSHHSKRPWHTRRPGMVDGCWWSSTKESGRSCLLSGVRVRTTVLAGCC